MLQSDVGWLSHVDIEQCCFVVGVAHASRFQQLQDFATDGEVVVTLVLSQLPGVPFGFALRRTKEDSDCFWHAVRFALEHERVLMPGQHCSLSLRSEVVSFMYGNPVALRGAWNGWDASGTRTVSWFAYINGIANGAPAGAPEALAVSLLFDVCVVITIGVPGGDPVRFGDAKAAVAVALRLHNRHFDALIPNRSDGGQNGPTLTIDARPFRSGQGFARGSGVIKVLIHELLGGESDFDIAGDES